MCLNGHISLAAKSYKYAVGKNCFLQALVLPFWFIMLDYYHSAYKKKPDDSLVNLSLGISFIHYAMQRKTLEKNKCVAKVIKYALPYFIVLLGVHISSSILWTWKTKCTS